MSTELIIIFFNINEYSDEIKENIEQNFREDNSQYLTYFLEYFLSEHIIVDLEKYTDNPSQIQYNFIYQIEPGKTASCNVYIINDFSKIHEICLYSDSYIIFCNPEQKETKSKIISIINYIKNDCCNDIITNIIGIYNNLNSNKIKLNDMKSFLNSQNFLYKYYQIYVEKEFNIFLKEKFNIQNINEEKNIIEDNNYNNDYDLIDNSEDKQFGNILQTLEKIFISIFQEKRMRGPRFEIINETREDKSDISKSCIIS